MINKMTLFQFLNTYSMHLLIPLIKNYQIDDPLTKGHLIVPTTVPLPMFAISKHKSWSDVHLPHLVHC